MSEALRLAEWVESDMTCEGDAEIAAELRRLVAENEALKTVMVAAAEEISEHWDAHCDSEGYGPVNLMRRLEEGIPSQYGYTAGEFARLRALNAELVEALRRVLEVWQDDPAYGHGAADKAWELLVKIEASNGS